MIDSGSRSKFEPIFPKSFTYENSGIFGSPKRMPLLGFVSLFRLSLF